MTVEDVMEDDRLLRGLIEMDDDELNSLVEDVRREKFRFLWEHTEMSEDEVLESVKRKEEIFIDEYEEAGLREGTLRLIAHDTVIDFLHEELVKKGLIEE